MASSTWTDPTSFSFAPSTEVKASDFNTYLLNNVLWLKNNAGGAGGSATLVVGGTSMTISSSGVWVVGGYCQVSAGSGRRVVQLNRNGAAVCYATGMGVDGGIASRFTLLVVERFTSGDRLAYALNASDSASINGGRLAGVRIGA